MKYIRFIVLSLLLVLPFSLVMVGIALAQTDSDSPPNAETKGETAEATDVPETYVVPLGAGLSLDSTIPGTTLAPGSPMGQDMIQESEPNNTAAQANPLGNNVVVLGNIYPNGDNDYYSFTANAGDRVYAATMTSFSANSSNDSNMDILDTDGVTVLENDNDNGSVGSLSSSIAGTTLPAAGTYYIRMRHNSTTNQLRPYHLHLQVQSGTPTPETEPNDAGQPLPVSGWVSGLISSTTDVDIYTLSLNAGDTVFLSLDLDPERDTVEWNGWIGLGSFDGFFLVLNDLGTTGPDSEAFFMTVKEAGTYSILVSVPTGGSTFGTYHLSASVHPAATQTCTTYTSSDTPIAIVDVGTVMSNITVPGNPRIGDLDVTVNLTHTFMADLDVTLMSPAGNENGLFTDIGSATFPIMNLTLDDEAGSPPIFGAMNGIVYQPELSYRLSWFDNEDAGGTWTLVVRDDAAGATGNLLSWSLTVCEPPPPPVCPVGTTMTTVYLSDFETDDGGFTHSGTADEWERGLPSFAPITSCNSGVNCWKTDLDNTYNASSSQDLLSPNINLSGYVSAAWVTWAQKYQMENATWDHAFVDVQQAGGTNPSRLWEWLDATMTTPVGSPSVTIQESAGWGEYTADISSYLGQNIELRFHVDSDTSVQLGGLAIDDVMVVACQPPPGTPFISLNKTVGTDASSCAATDSIMVAPGTDVTYCYEVANTGTVTFTMHDLVDNELGTILSGFPYTLTAGASVFVTQTVTITQSTVNTATWTAYNPGPTDVVMATDTATVNVPIPASYPVCADFESGALPSFMFAETGSSGAANGRVQVTTAYPHTGSFAMDIDTNCDGCGGNTLQSGTMVMDLAGQSGVELNLWVFEHGDENHAEDGIFISDDGGATWAQILSLNNFPASYQQVIINLDAATSGAGMSYVDDFMIRFQSFDNFSIDLDGYSFDDICVQPASPNIDVSPASLNSTQLADEVVTQTLTINNVGGADLTWNITEAPTDCGTPGDVSWLQATPTSGTTPASGSDDVSVIFDSTGLTPNTTYNGLLCVNSDDPDTPVTPVPVTLMVAEAGACTIGTWQTVTPVNTGRSRSGLAYLASTGNFYLAGGEATGGNRDIPIEEYDPVANTWTNRSNLLTGVSNTGVAGAGAYIYVPGGFNGTAGIAAMQRFDPVANTVVTMTAMPAGNFGHAVTVLDGKIYVLGGSSTGAAGTTNFIYDIGTDTWSTGASLLTAVNYPAAASDGTYVYVLGGTTTNLATVQRYNPGTNTWDTIANMGTGRGGPGAFFDGNNLWAVGGGWATYLTSTEYWDGVSWQAGPTMSVGVRTMGAAFGNGLALKAAGWSGAYASAAEVLDITCPLAGPVINVDPTALAATQEAGIISTQSLTITNSGDTDLNWDVIEEASTASVSVGLELSLDAICMPNDLPWVSANPLSGTTAPGGSSVVDVTFDSTGLTPGVYTGSLCIDSDDPVTPQVRVPLTLTVEETPINYGVTVSAVDDALSGNVGTTVTYTVWVTNTGDATDTFMLDVSGASWLTTLETMTVTLGSGLGTSVEVTVQIPLTATHGSTDMATVSATSLADPSATDSVMLTTTAVVPEPEDTFIYLPIIMKP